MGDAETISDSESIATIGDLGGNGSGHEGELKDENKNEWEHLSPKEMRFLASSGGRVSPAPPGSPLAERGMHRRASSSGGRPGSRPNSQSSPLRPVLPFGLDNLTHDDAIALEEEQEPDAYAQPLAKPKEGGIDEVEHIFGT